jgi:branched-chain amino acid aminotransferase
VKVKIADHFSRAANGGTGFAKCAGNYGGQFYPSTLAKEEGYQSVIWTDDATHTLLEEAGQMNFMIRIGDTLRTAPVSERLLDGITRRSILRLAEDMGIKAEVGPISVEEVLEAGRKGEVKEAFGCGTAAVVSPICGIGYKGEYIDIPALSAEESFGERLRQRIFDIQYNRTEDPYGWRVEVE